METSRYQKAQGKPTWRDYKALAKTIKQLKASAGHGVRIRPITRPCVATWTDSTLFGVTGEEIADEDVDKFDKHKIYSQCGCLIGLLSADDLDCVDNNAVSFLDWRSRGSNRIFHSTFGAETNAGLDVVVMAVYVRAFFCDIMLGSNRSVAVDEYCEDHMRTSLFTDCR